MTPHRLSKDQQVYADALTETSTALGLIGQFIPGHRHDKFVVILPDGSEVLLPVFKTPRCDAESYAVRLKGQLRGTIHRNLQRRGLV